MKRFILWKTTAIALSMLLPVGAFAQKPTFRIDFDMTGRPAAEVNEPGYIAWPIVDCATDSRIIDGVEVTLANNPPNSAAIALRSHWYKAGIQAPNYARLVSDGLTGKAGDGGTEIKIILSGLPAGKHTLMSYHNTVDNLTEKTFTDMEIYIDGKLVVKGLEPSNRALSNFEAQTAYLEFEAKEDTPVEFLFAPTYTSKASSWNVIINGLVLNEPNIMKQSRNPNPADADYHIDADNKQYTLSWTAANGAVAHEVYFGKDKEALFAADASSALCKGRQTHTTFGVNELYSMDTYYWRVDEVDEEGTVTKGDVWSFRPRQLAFPGAEGHGRFAIGGRGGKVVYVTNLNDDGPGSLREAITNDVGPRTIMFAVSGIIELKSRLVLNAPNVTVAGQTAPGKGICLTRAPFGMSGANDAIVRFIRVRLGSGTTYDGMGLQGSDHCILDHNSISWTIDEAFSSRSAKNITLQRTLISEALNAADHQNYPSGSQHGYAASISGDVGSFHHNLLAHCAGRNWSLAGGLDGNGYYAGRLDIFNNVVYNWRSRTTDGGAHEVNFVKNYYKPGAASTQNYALNAQWDGFPGTQRYYCDGNIVEGKFDDLTNPRNGCKSASGNPNPWSNTPFFPSHATVHTARDAYKHVLSDVGCTLPLMDDHDVRMVTETLGGTYSCKGSRTDLPGLPDSEQDVGGWEEYPALTRAANYDTDMDGLPDWWELMFGLNPNSPQNDFSDSNADDDGDGYTNLEEYLHWMATPRYETPIDKQIDIDLTPYTRGFEKEPVYALASIKNATAQVEGSILKITPNQGFSGLLYVDFSVTDADGTEMVRTLGLKVGEGGSHMYRSESEQTGFTIYPNPAVEILYVSTPVGEQAEATIEIATVYGHSCLVKKYQPSQGVSQQVDISSLEPGAYLVTIRCAGRQETMKLIKK